MNAMISMTIDANADALERIRSALGPPEQVAIALLQHADAALCQSDGWQRSWLTQAKRLPREFDIHALVTRYRRRTTTRPTVAIEAINPSRPVRRSSNVSDSSIGIAVPVGLHERISAMFLCAEDLAAELLWHADLAIRGGEAWHRPWLLQAFPAAQ